MIFKMDTIDACLFVDFTKACRFGLFAQLGWGGSGRLEVGFVASLNGRSFFYVNKLKLTRYAKIRSTNTIESVEIIYTIHQASLIIELNSIILGHFIA